MRNFTNTSAATGSFMPRMWAGGTRSVERQPAGHAPVALDQDLTLIPTPGHTPGSVCLLYRDKYLFSGDHIAYSPKRDSVHAFADACWYDWKIQRESVLALTHHAFE